MTRPPAFEILLPGKAPLVPVIVHVPHAGRRFPDLVACDLMLTRRQLRRELSVMTDHHTDRLALDALAAGAAVFVNRVSRLVVDPERFPDDRQEKAAEHGMGAVYTRTHQGRSLRYPDFGPDQRQALMDKFYHPYHQAFTLLVDQMLARFGTAFIIDLHSFPDRPLPIQEPGGHRPDLCLGYEEFHRPEGWTRWWETRTGFSPIIAHNQPFAGSFVPAAHYRSDRRVRSLMVELNRKTYLHQGSDQLRRPCPMTNQLRQFFHFACADVAARVRPPHEGISRRQARLIAQEYLRARDPGCDGRIGRVEHPADLPLRAGALPFCLYGVGAEAQRDSWVAFIKGREPFLLRSSDIVLVDRQTGKVTFAGPANDEG